MKNPLLWTCGCGFQTPRHPATKREEVGPCPRCGSIDWLEDSLEGPQVQVYCSGCKKLVDERETEFVDIAEDIQGCDLLTFKCKKCGQQSTSRRFG